MVPWEGVDKHFGPNHVLKDINLSGLLAGTYFLLNYGLSRWARSVKPAA
jgi:hypothetical protein